MGKLRPRDLGENTAADDEAAQALLPPPPPLQPRPGMLQGLLQLQSPTADFVMPQAEAEMQPLDYSMKRLQQHPSHSLESPSSSPSPTSSSSSSSTADEVLHRLRHAVLQRHQLHQPKSASCFAASAPAAAAAFAKKSPTTAAAAVTFAASVTTSSAATATAGAAAAAAVDSETDAKAAYAAECIKSRLDGCGKRVHLFLGILLHFGMPPSRDGRQIFDRVIAFSDENKNLSDQPTAYFMVLESRLLALIWSKFKGNSSNEYSTLTRAIRSTRQKYKGIFEAVPNPGKKLYKFGPQAVEQFRHLFPQSYTTTTTVVKAESV